MRQASVSEIKRGRAIPVENLMPREGSRIRKVADFLLDNRGEWVKIPWQEFGIKTHHLGTMIAQLRDFYGMDIRSAGPHKGYCLRGEYMGKDYICYLPGASNA